MHRIYNRHADWVEIRQSRQFKVPGSVFLEEFLVIAFGQSLPFLGMQAMSRTVTSLESYTSIEHRCTKTKCEMYQLLIDIPDSVARSA